MPKVKKKRSITKVNNASDEIVSSRVPATEGFDIPKRFLKERPAEEIKILHKDVKSALPKAIRIGELLTKQKKQLRHGKWLKWVKDELPFGARTASTYMNYYENRARLKSEALPKNLWVTNGFSALCRVDPLRAIRRGPGSLRRSSGTGER